MASTSAGSAGRSRSDGSGVGTGPLLMRKIVAAAHRRGCVRHGSTGFPPRPRAPRLWLLQARPTSPARPSSQGHRRWISPHFVEPDRVHKTVYTDQQIFDVEMEKIWERIWVYCGHESQVPKPGDYYAVTIGRQPMIMVRQHDGSVQVLYNRCPHRGMQLVGNLKGNTGSSFVCSYHAWSFHLDGSVRAIPLAQGLRGHAHDARQPRLRHEARGARRQLPRLRVREPRRRRPVADGVPRRGAASPSTTCATARRSARSRWCRSATA